MKILTDKYPKGTWKGQKSDGRYVDETLYQNLFLVSKNIVNNNSFMCFVFSSTLGMGTGKSTFASQLAEAYAYQLKKLHNIDISLTVNNCAFTSKTFIDTCLKLKKYSPIILDEWEDSHYWSEMGIALRHFIQKARQLNLFMICVVPSFFRVPTPYAVEHSLFAVDVKFTGEFKKGYFDFYSMKNKNKLFLDGKKKHDYSVAHADFDGRFFEGMAWNEEEYLVKKATDLENFMNKESKSGKGAREDKLTLQRDILLEYLYTNGMTAPQIVQLIAQNGVEIGEMTIRDAFSRRRSAKLVNNSNQEKIILTTQPSQRKNKNV